MRDPFLYLNDHVNVSRETFERLSIYHNLLIKWQGKINLISNDTIPITWKRHFLDSIQIIKFLPDENALIVDVGTGAGFPGMVLSVMGYKNVHLIESDSKKVAFLKNVSRETFSSVSIHHNRAENILLENVDVIISRAVSELSKLLDLVSKNVSRETFCLFHKGKNWSKEIEDAKKIWSFDQEIAASITDPHGVIIKLSHIQRRKL